MNELDVIEAYVDGQMATADRLAFETSLRTDPTLADALAFYVMAKSVAKKQADDQRRIEWDARRRSTAANPQRLPTRRIGQWLYPLAAAACLVIALSVGWYFVNKPDGPELANAYVRENLTALPVAMGGRADSLQRGIQYYNTGKLADADATFGAMLQREPTNADVLKFAGIVSLRRDKNDQAIDQFHRLSQRTDLYDNPGMFYEAVALLKRNRPADKNQARNLLTAVITNNLSGKADAEKLLENL